MGTNSGAWDAFDLPRQPSWPTGELAGVRGIDLVRVINDGVLLQTIRIYYKVHGGDRGGTGARGEAAALGRSPRRN